MEKSEQRALLKRIQAITNNRGDSEVESVLAELRAFLDSVQTTRQETGGIDRQERAGRTRGKQK